MTNKLNHRQPFGSSTVIAADVTNLMQFVKKCMFLVIHIVVKSFDQATNKLNIVSLRQTKRSVSDHRSNALTWRQRETFCIFFLQRSVWRKVYPGNSLVLQSTSLKSCTIYIRVTLLAFLGVLSLEKL